MTSVLIRQGSWGHTQTHTHRHTHTQRHRHRHRHTHTDTQTHTHTHTEGRPCEDSAATRPGGRPQEDQPRPHPGLGIQPPGWRQGLSAVSAPRLWAFASATTGNEYRVRPSGLLTRRPNHISEENRHRDRLSSETTV